MGLRLTKLCDRLLALPKNMRGARRFSNEHIALLVIPLVFVASILALITLPNTIADRMVLVDTNRRAELWQRRVENLFSDMIDGLNSQMDTKPTQERLLDVARSSDIYRMKVFDGSGTIIWAEAIRASIEALRVRYGEDDLPAITISIGVALSPTHAQTVEDLLKVADDALYAAKDSGQNRVAVAGDSAQRVPKASGPHTI